MKMSPEMDKLATALSKAQAVMTGAVKSRKNPHYGNAYATLGDVWDAIREPLSANGLSIVQTVNVEQNPVLTTVLLHSSGQYIAGDYPLTPMKNDPQAWGSAVSYARRYMLMSVLGVPAEDDDGNAASTAPRPVAQSAPAAPPPPPASNAPAPAKSAGSWEIPLKGSQWAEWCKAMADKLAKCPDLKSYEKLWADNDAHLVKLMNADQKLHDKLMAAATARKTALTKEAA